MARPAVFGIRPVVAGTLAAAACVSALAAAQGSANEAGARRTLRAIVSGQITYSAVCSTGFYAPTLADLGRPAKGAKTGFILDTDVPPKGATVLEKWRYRIEMTAPPAKASPASCNGVPAGGSAQSFVITARPLPGFSGRAFRIDDKGELTEIK